MVMFISTSHFFPKNYLFQLFPNTSFRYYCCWKTLLLISWSSIPCLRDDKIWLGLSIYSSSCGKHSPIVWNNMERVIETKLSKVSQNLSLVLVNGIRLTTSEDWSSVYPQKKKISKISNFISFHTTNMPQNWQVRKLVCRTKMSDVCDHSGIKHFLRQHTLCNMHLQRIGWGQVSHWTGATDASSYNDFQLMLF